MCLKLILFIVVAARTATVVHSLFGIKGTQKLGQRCWALKPCVSGLSCQPFVHKCYHKPRKFKEPCSAGYSCGRGLSCQAFVHKCYHKPRRFKEPCSAGYSCGRGLSCQPGVHKCYHNPRRENEPCAAGYGCAPSLACTLCSKSWLAECQISRVPAFSNKDYRKPYNKVAFLVTHNSFSYVIHFAYKVFARNQKYSITKQLNDGVRGFMLDIYPGTGNVKVLQCHGNCKFGSLDLLRTLTDIRKFLDNNPKDVVTIFFEDKLKNAPVLSKVFRDAKISHHVLNYKFFGNRTKNWPTLREMASLGRLVVFSSYATDEFPYSRYNMWKYVKENRFGNPGKNTNKCEARDESKRPKNTGLVLVNWFHTLPLPFPCLNDESMMKKKLKTCRQKFGKWANFVAVDYYSGISGVSGGAFEVVQWLNRRL